MRLKNILGLFVAAFFVVDVTFAVICVGATVYADQENYAKSTFDDFERIFRANRTELVANLTLNHKRLVGEQIKRLARQEGLAVSLNGLTVGAENLTGSGNPIVREFDIEYGGKSYGSLTLSRRGHPYLDAISKPVAVLFAGHLGLFVLALALLVYWSKRGLVRPFEAIVAQAKGDGAAIAGDGLWVSRELLSLSESLAVLWKDLAEKTRKLGADEVATQVAHDIRSPLAALEVVSRESAQLPEELRVLVRSSVSRVRDIANTLLAAHRGDPPAEQDDEPQMVSALVELIATEKRVQHSKLVNVGITTHLEKNAYGAFAMVGPSDFKRLLSNLIENAIGAVGQSGQVRIDVALDSENVVVSVRDDGPGISPEILSQLGGRGATFGKANGNGLGLYQAFQLASKWGGELIVESSVKPHDSGTDVSLRVPLIGAPSWFQSVIRVPTNALIVVVDDDTSIHEVWRRRFASAGIAASQMRHFSTASEFKEWHAQSPAKELVFLFDYELADKRETGLDLIDRLRITARCSLVTSHFEETYVRKRCHSLGVRIVPKSLAGFIPVVLDDKGAATQMVVSRQQNNGSSDAKRTTVEVN